ncbi:hypothetical protein SAMN03159512_05986 [Pseudomonas sp. NFR09]|nr:hypothetical protein SAMN03159512_05986 [Pseudomonas sp. NFR09]
MLDHTDFSVGIFHISVWIKFSRILSGFICNPIRDQRRYFRVRLVEWMSGLIDVLEGLTSYLSLCRHFWCSALNRSFDNIFFG